MNKPEPGESFETTHWSMILAAVDHDVADCREAMQQLCQRYWFPLYAFTRRRGYETNHAQDLIQAFFLRVLEKDVLSKADRKRGRFRTFLLASLKNFLANESAKAATRRRGGEHRVISLDFRDAEGRLAHEPADNLTADAHYHRQWALAVLRRALENLEAEFASEGNSNLFDALRPYLAADSQRLPYAALTESLGMSTDAIKVAVHRVRRRYRTLLESEIVDTVSSRADIDQEIQDLFRALSANSHPPWTG